MKTRKLNLHIFSSDYKDCIYFVNIKRMLNFKIINKLLLKQIQEKLTLLSLMIYFVYDNEYKMMYSQLKKEKKPKIISHFLRL